MCETLTFFLKTKHIIVTITNKFFVRDFKFIFSRNKGTSVQPDQNKLEKGMTANADSGNIERPVSADNNLNSSRSSIE